MSEAPAQSNLPLTQVGDAPGIPFQFVRLLAWAMIAYGILAIAQGVVSIVFYWRLLPYLVTGADQFTQVGLTGVSGVILTAGIALLFQKKIASVLTAIIMGVHLPLCCWWSYRDFQIASSPMAAFEAAFDQLSQLVPLLALLVGVWLPDVRRALRGSGTMNQQDINRPTAAPLSYFAEVQGAGRQVIPFLAWTAMAYGVVGLLPMMISLWPSLRYLWPNEVIALGANVLFLAYGIPLLRRRHLSALLMAGMVLQVILSVVQTYSGPAISYTWAVIYECLGQIRSLLIPAMIFVALCLPEIRRSLRRR
ncbi:MAG TPA: hypothetical protein VMD30_09160 [Tepidisphaeraceae bacterium]|nr:hypothetical protein [Tepidisphaeraceae bacterium]